MKGKGKKVHTQNVSYAKGRLRQVKADSHVYSAVDPCVKNVGNV
jgi:hypothetical protein